MACSLCWKCKNAVKGCCWSKNFIPVPGWLAIPTKIKQYAVGLNGYKTIDSFRVVKCPKFEPDEKSDFELALELGVSLRTIQRWKQKGVKL